MAGHFTAEQLDAVTAALTRGEHTVTYADGSSVTCKSTAELLALRDRMMRELASAAGTPRPQAGYAVFRRG